MVALALVAGITAASAHEPRTPAQTTAIEDNSTGPFNPNEPRETMFRGSST
jgi:hypothetical protein